jgi:pyruvate/2-oxoglutarate dehydrogenase complex dihydrolipoamide dehydrogenase (E3) component
VLLESEAGGDVTLRGNILLVVVGRKPNIEGIGLEKIGVEFARRGLKVCEHMKTNLRHFYGAGDAAGGYLFPHAAGYKVWTEKFRGDDRSLVEEEKVGAVKLLLDQKEKPIGIQILGPDADNILREWVAVMNGGVKLSTIASATHSYPTL